MEYLKSIFQSLKSLSSILKILLSLTDCFISHTLEMVKKFRMPIKRFQKFYIIRDWDREVWLVRRFLSST